MTYMNSVHDFTHKYGNWKNDVRNFFVNLERLLVCLTGEIEKGNIESWQQEICKDGIATVNDYQARVATLLEKLEGASLSDLENDKVWLCVPRESLKGFAEVDTSD